MNAPAPPGQGIGDEERLYRLITTENWWTGGRVGSGAFSGESFSVNRASLATIEDCQRQLNEMGHSDGGVVSFLAGDARALEFDVRAEADPLYPENLAHAHVFNNGGNSGRKKRAKKLVLSCVVEVAPRFDATSPSPPTADF